MRCGSTGGRSAARRLVLPGGHSRHCEGKGTDVKQGAGMNLDGGYRDGLEFGVCSVGIAAVCARSESDRQRGRERGDFVETQSGFWRRETVRGRLFIVKSGREGLVLCIPAASGATAGRGRRLRQKRQRAVAAEEARHSGRGECEGEARVAGRNG